MPRGIVIGNLQGTVNTTRYSVESIDHGTIVTVLSRIYEASSNPLAKCRNSQLRLDWKVWDVHETNYFKTKIQKAQEKNSMLAMVAHRAEVPLDEALELVMIDPQIADTKKLKRSSVNFGLIKHNWASFDDDNAKREEFLDTWDFHNDDLYKKSPRISGQKKNECIA